uniref:L1 transposable element RRM domain-containing protein n=1 Tax=Latimeria chalumnae TaxID=7897 RepID=H3AYE3_LATCH
TREYSEDEESESNSSKSFKALITEMKEEHNTINKNLQELTFKILNLDMKMDNLARHLDETEKLVGDMENIHRGLNSSIEHLQNKLQTISNKCEHLESGSRQLNVRLMDLPEGEEGRNLTISESNDTFPCGLKTEQVHPSLKSKPNSGKKPRMLIIKLLKFRDQEVILQRATDVGPLPYKNQPV